MVLFPDWWDVEEIAIRARVNQSGKLEWLRIQILTKSDAGLFLILSGLCSHEWIWLSLEFILVSQLLSEQEVEAELYN